MAKWKLITPAETIVDDGAAITKMLSRYKTDKKKQYELYVGPYHYLWFVSEPEKVPPVIHELFEDFALNYYIGNKQPPQDKINLARKALNASRIEVFELFELVTDDNVETGADNGKV